MEQELQKELREGLIFSPIPYYEVKEMVATLLAYESKRNGHDAGTYVKSVWFDIKDIKKMCERLVEEGADGLRVYFGRYPADVSKFVEPKPKPNTNSLIFVSTGNIDGVKHSDYFVDLNPITPENRGEQCQPHCGGTSPEL
jgi:hypothetical protein